jgi:hypothetical protein
MECTRRSTQKRTAPKGGPWSREGDLENQSQTGRPSGDPNTSPVLFAHGRPFLLPIDLGAQAYTPDIGAVVLIGTFVTFSVKGIAARDLRLGDVEHQARVVV